MWAADPSKPLACMRHGQAAGVRGVCTRAGVRVQGSDGVRTGGTNSPDYGGFHRLIMDFISNDYIIL